LAVLIVDWQLGENVGLNFSGGIFHPERKDQVHLLCHDMTDIQDLYKFNLQWIGVLLVKSLTYLALLRNGDGNNG
jgi:hypothetical protein